MSETKTLGEKRVRVAFNPDNNETVHVIKTKAAELIDLLEAQRNTDAPRSEKNRLISIAQTEIETAAMYAVKAATTTEEHES